MASYNDRTRALLDSLVNLTEKRKIQWVSVSKYACNSRNTELRMYLISNNKYIYSFGTHPIIDEGKSLCAEIESGYVYLFVYSTMSTYSKTKQEYTICALQNSANSSITAVTSRSSFQTECETLRKKIEKELSDQNLCAFWDKIISLSNEKQ